MSERSPIPESELVSPDVEELVIRSLQALYREIDVQWCLANRGAHRPSEEPYHAYRLKDWAARTHWPVSLAEEHVTPGGRVLIVGCGMGRMCMWFAEAGYAVTGIDIVPELVDTARKATEVLTSVVQPVFLVVDGFNWPIGVEEFECVVMMASFLTHCPTASIRARLFSETFRVLRPGGCLLVEATDRTHPGFDFQAVKLSMSCQDIPMEMRIFDGQPGVVIGRFHPFRFEGRAESATAWYFADPLELWKEVESTGLRLIRLQTEQDATDTHACVTVVARKDKDRALS